MSPLTRTVAAAPLYVDVAPHSGESSLARGEARGISSSPRRYSTTSREYSISQEIEIESIQQQVVFKILAHYAARTGITKKWIMFTQNIVRTK